MPININKADYDHLNPYIRFLSDLQITEIIRHRILYGDFLSILELQSLPSLDAETIRRISSFITTKDDVSKSFNLPIYGRVDLWIRFPYNPDDRAARRLYPWWSKGIKAKA